MEREEALELARSRLIVALDVGSAAEAHELVDRLAPAVSFFKVGLELFTAAGPPVVEALVAAGHRCFLDLKLLDIPATVARATAAAARLGAELLTVHADPAAVAAAAHGRPGGRPRILVVGLLTSAGAADAAARVAAAARIAAEAGADGVVAAARPEEIDAVRRASPALTVVCPG
ncbi:MAG: orotidine-5'-phosphate decarboxylase, partial [Nitrospirae bacterium]